MYTNRFRASMVFLLCSMSLLLLIIACRLPPNEEESSDAEKTVKANEIELTLQFQQLQLTSQAKTLEAPAQPPAPPLATQPLLPVNTPEQPYEEGVPFIRALQDINCYDAPTKIKGENYEREIYTVIKAGETSEIIIYWVDDNTTWFEVWIPSEPNCSCVITNTGVEINGDLSKAIDANPEGLIIGFCR